jgi:hypothetical protein
LFSARATLQTAHNAPIDDARQRIARIASPSSFRPVPGSLSEEIARLATHYITSQKLSSDIVLRQSIGHRLLHPAMAQFFLFRRRIPSAIRSESDA